MFKQVANGLTLEVEIDGTEMLDIDSSRISECISFVRNSDIKTITINDVRGFTGDNLEFLYELADVVEGLHLVIGSRTSLAPINSLHKLKLLRFEDNERDTVSLANFPELEELAAYATPRLTGLETCKNLKSLSLRHYNAKTKDLTTLPAFESLSELNLYVSNISSLDGIEKYQKLKRFQIYRAPKLETIHALEELKSLEYLEINSCKRVRDFQTLSEIPSLTQLKLLHSGEIESLSFIDPLKNLWLISINETNILDGDLSYLERLPLVGFDDKKHYSLKSKHFEPRNAAWRQEHDVRPPWSK